MLKDLALQIRKFALPFLCLLGIAPSAFAQSSVLFGYPTSTNFPHSFGLQENAGLSAVVFNGYLDVFFRGDSNDTQGVPYLCGYGYSSTLWCFEDGEPSSTGPGQAVVFKNKVYWAYAYSATNQLVVCSSSQSSNGLDIGNCNMIPGIYVAKTRR
jgi:hypothetical protein